MTYSSLSQSTAAERLQIRSAYHCTVIYNDVSLVACNCSKTMNGEAGRSLNIQLYQVRRLGDILLRHTFIPHIFFSRIDLECL